MIKAKARAVWGLIFLFLNKQISFLKQRCPKKIRQQTVQAFILCSIGKKFLGQIFSCCSSNHVITHYMLCWQICNTYCCLSNYCCRTAGIVSKTEQSTVLRLFFIWSGPIDLIQAVYNRYTMTRLWCHRRKHRLSTSFLNLPFVHCGLSQSDLQLPLQQWGTGNVYLLVLSKAKR